MKSIVIVYGYIDFPDNLAKTVPLAESTGQNIRTAVGNAVIEALSEFDVRIKISTMLIPNEDNPPNP